MGPWTGTPRWTRTSRRSPSPTAPPLRLGGNCAGGYRRASTRSPATACRAASAATRRNCASTARKKRYLSLYVTRTDVVAAHAGRLAGCSVGKGCIRFPLGHRTDLDLVASLVSATGATHGPVW
jgi:hypothetical protein